MGMKVGNGGINMTRATIGLKNTMTMRKLIMRKNVENGTKKLTKKNPEKGTMTMLKTTLGKSKGSVIPMSMKIKNDLKRLSVLKNIEILHRGDATTRRKEITMKKKYKRIPVKKMLNQKLMISTKNERRKKEKERSA